MKKILVIEDEQPVRENLVELLEAENYEAIAAANGRIGLQLANSESPDLILCDVMMPEVNGYTVLTKLRDNPLTAVIPFVFLTAKSARNDFRLGMELGADDYLPKPFTRAELLSAINSRLQKQAILKKQLSSPPQEKAFDSEMLVVKSMLRGALQGGDLEQFQVYYQPIIEVKSGKVIAAESLLRWHSPELGLVSTAELIPLAESTGLIIPLGEWVLQRVCKQIKTWRSQGFSCLQYVAVNLSARQFSQPELCTRIAKILKHYNLEPNFLQLELAENMLIQDVNNAILTMNELRSLGVKIAIDDFGTGNSSLIYLKNLPVNTLKIDSYFIQNIANDSQKAAITTALIQMGHNLNLQVSAKGVETPAELTFLRQQNCDDMQGFLFSQPIPPTEFEKLFMDDKCLFFLRSKLDG